MLPSVYTATTCNGPSTFGVETCTRALEPETAYQAFEETVNGNVIFDNSVEEDAKAGARAQRKRRLLAVEPIVWTEIGVD